VADEKQARHALADMQSKIGRSAYDALGITAGEVGPEHVRAAFLQLAKTFHPMKFARMSTDVQKLANEVFLGLRAAHDQLARPKAAAQRPSGPIPAIIASKTPAPDLVRNASGVRPNLPPAPTSSLNPPTQRGVQPVPATTAAAPRQASQSTPVARAGTAPLPTTAPARPTPAAPTTTSQPVRRMTPVGGVPVVARPPTATGNARPSPPPTATATAPAAGGAEPELAGVLAQLEKGQLEQARTTLTALIALQPKPRYRALLHYAIGREAQLTQNVNEARVELQSALAIDPDLQLAKTALAELFTRRK